MKTNLIRPLTSRRAFTLVELIVVLMILVGLAAVLIPAITDMVARTNRSTASSNISEVAAAIQRYEAQYMAYPENLDGLMEDLAGEDLGSVISSLTSATADVTLDANTLATLNAAGITRVGIHADDDGTFELPTSTLLTNTTVLKGLSPATQVALGLETSGTAGKYIVLGVGALSDMNGKTMLDAPVHFPRDSTMNPQTVYCRFLAIFQITDGATALDRAKLVGVMAPDASGLSTEMDNYFQIAANN
ncbi:MAG: prepilin-type N-terminal cleavage/methylation domain-containing protein [Pirellulaceae bacterium]|nr:prepilin-type N-terminal cleavage/methylation domain-containing protein [Pirellulaceae bacterium]